MDCSLLWTVKCAPAAAKEFCDPGNARRGPGRAGVTCKNDLTDEGIIAAAFARNPAEAQLATGYGKKSCQRSVVVISEALARQVNARLAELVGREFQELLVLKRSKDETPLRVNTCLLTFLRTGML